MTRATSQALRAIAARVRDGARSGRHLAAAAGRLLWPPRPRHAAAALAASVGGLGLYGMAFQTGLSARLPSDLDWRAAAAVLARDARPGDAVALAPPWAERARGVLPASLPILALPRYDGEDLLGVRRVWLLSLPEVPWADDAIERDLAARAGGREVPQRLGALALDRYDLAAPLLPAAFLPDRLGSARVSLGGTACPLEGGTFRCPSSPSRAAREVREVDGRPRPCLVLRPDPSAPLTALFPGVPPGRLRGHAGLTGLSPFVEASPLRLSVRDGERAAADLTLGTPGWFGIGPGEAARDPREVTVVLAPGDPRREVCLDLHVLP